MNTKIMGFSAALGALAICGSAHAAGTTTEISFDGFCNTMKVTVFSWHQAGTVETGCQTGRVGVGMEGKVLGAKWKGKTLTIGENPDTTEKMYLYNIQYPLVSGGGWSLFSTTDGVNFTPLNSGTYTITGADSRSARVGPPTDRPANN